MSNITEKCAAFAPMPVLSNGKGKLWEDSSTKEWFTKIEEEVLEAHEAAIEAENYPMGCTDELAEELTDIITVCVSYLHALGYDERERAELINEVNMKNAKRGYFKAE